MGSQDFRGSSRCTYCEKEGHRQGPTCDLWCKHRAERGIPITRFAPTLQDQRGKAQANQTPQLNAVMVTEDNIVPSADLVNHVKCDCSECLIQGSTEDVQDILALAVTRAAKAKQGPIHWEDQQKVRTKVQKRLDKQNPLLQDIVSEQIEENNKEQYADGRQNSDLPLEDPLFEELMHSGVQISLDKLLTLVPAFRDLLFKRILQKKAMEFPEQ